MPISLTTPWNPGHFDPGKTYVRAKIVNFTVHPDRKIIRVTIDFGDEVDGVWVSGAAREKERVVVIRGDDYDAMATALPEAGETVYAALKRMLYTYLTANEADLAGLVE